MKKLFTTILIMASIVTFAQIEGTWKVANQAGAIGVGPELGNISWWANSEGDLTLRACYFDDKYVFDEDGSFSNVLDDETWIEEWQGMNPPACGTPVAPHDGSNEATWTYDEGAGELTLEGVGAYLGLAKVFNEGELTTPDDAPESITYMLAFSPDNDTITIDISIGSGYWRYIMARHENTGILETSFNQTKVYPNPASDILYIENAKDYAEMKIFSNVGQLLYSSDKVNNSIDLNDFSPGVYTFRAIGFDGQLYQAKFIVK